MMARNTIVQFMGRIQKRKTNHLQVTTFVLQRAAGPRWAKCRLMLGEALRELTAREREVLDLVAQGLDNNRIAAALQISEKTARNHVSRVFGKLGVNSRAQAVVVARDAGLGRNKTS